MAKKFITEAIRHAGALHKQLGVPQGEKIPAKKLAKAAAKGGTLGRRARFAETLKGLHHAGHHPHSDHKPGTSLHAHTAKQAKKHQG